jgi:hypothetical protein
VIVTDEKQNPASSMSAAESLLRSKGWKQRHARWMCPTCLAPKPKKSRPTTFAKDRLYVDGNGAQWKCHGTRGHNALMTKVAEGGTPVPMDQTRLAQLLKPYRAKRT